MKNLMTIEERKALGYRLKAARKEKGLSQEELANIVGVKVGTISKYEQGDRIPSFARIFDLAAVTQPFSCRLVKMCTVWQKHLPMSSAWTNMQPG